MNFAKNHIYTLFFLSLSPRAGHNWECLLGPWDRGISSHCFLCSSCGKIGLVERAIGRPLACYILIEALSLPALDSYLVPPSSPRWVLGLWPRIKFSYARNDAEAETLILWPPHAKSWLIGKEPDAGRDWGQEKGTTEDELAGWCHQLDGHEFG